MCCCLLSMFVVILELSNGWRRGMCEGKNHLMRMNVCRGRKRVTGGQGKKEVKLTNHIGAAGVDSRSEAGGSGTSSGLGGGPGSIAGWFARLFARWFARLFARLFIVARVRQRAYISRSPA